MNQAVAVPIRNMASARRDDVELGYAVEVEKSTE